MWNKENSFSLIYWCLGPAIYTRILENSWGQKMVLYSDITYRPILNKPEGFHGSTNLKYSGLNNLNLTRDFSNKSDHGTLLSL